MFWEIREMVSEPGIINVTMDREETSLQWDFMLGSSFDLCAVFSWDGEMTLIDYQSKGIRPYLYHKNLRKYRNIVYDEEWHGYALYPAVIEKNTLYIGTKGEHFILSESGQKQIVGIQYITGKKCLWKWHKIVKAGAVRLDLEQPCRKIYYRIENSKEEAVSDLVYEAVVEKRLQIYLKTSEKVTYYYDKACKKEIPAKKQGAGD